MPVSRASPCTVLDILLFANISESKLIMRSTHHLDIQYLIRLGQFIDNPGMSEPGIKDNVTKTSPILCCCNVRLVLATYQGMLAA